MRKLIISIHGVGNERPNRLLGSSQKNYSEHDSKEIVWNNFAKNYHDGILDKIGSNFRACFIVSNSDFSSPKDSSSQLLYYLNYLMQCLAFLIPLALFITILCYFLEITYSQEMCAYNSSLRPIKLFIDTICAPSYLLKSKKIALLFWFFLLFTSILFFVISTITIGFQKGVKVFSKAVLLKVIPNLIFVPLIILFILVISIALFALLGSGEVSDPVIGKLRKSSFSDQLIIFIVTTLVVVVFTYLIYLFYRKFLRPLIKVMLDIFLYITDSRYRDELQNYVNHEIESSVNNRDVIILSHSLGTLIITDSLINNKQWKKASSITLITMGSPLRKLIENYFPYLFSIEQLWINAKLKYKKKFRWFNLFRPYDPIGTDFKSIGVSDINTEQYDRKLVSAHTNYWDDPAVVTIIKSKIIDNSNFASKETLQKENEKTVSFQLPQYFENSFLLKNTKNTLKFIIPSFFLLIAILNHSVFLDKEANQCVSNKESIAMEYGEKHTANVYMTKMEVIDPKLKGNWVGDRTYPDIVFLNFESNDTIDFIKDLLYLKLDNTLLYLMGWATVDKPKIKKEFLTDVKNTLGNRTKTELENYFENNPIKGIDFYTYTNYSWSKKDKILMILQFMKLKDFYKENNIVFQKDIYIIPYTELENGNIIYPQIIIPDYAYKHRFEIFLFIMGLITALIVYFLIFIVIINLNLN